MTLRLLLLASENWWRFDGWTTAHGVDAAELGLGRFSNLVRYWATEGAASEADIAKFEARLWMPPRGVEPDQGPWSAAAENRAFASLKSALGK